MSICSKYFSVDLLHTNIFIKKMHNNWYYESLWWGLCVGFVVVFKGKDWKEKEMYYFQISNKLKYGTPLVALLPLNKGYFNPVPAQFCSGAPYSNAFLWKNMVIPLKRKNKTLSDWAVGFFQKTQRFHSPPKIQDFMGLLVVLSFSLLSKQKIFRFSTEINWKY